MFSCFIQQSVDDMLAERNKQSKYFRNLRIRSKAFRILTIVLANLLLWFSFRVCEQYSWLFRVLFCIVSNAILAYVYFVVWPKQLMREQIRGMIKR